MGALRNCLVDRGPFAAHIRLRCPECGSGIEWLKCPACGFLIGIEDGILRALPDDRARYYAQFIGEYQRIRHAEGRGSECEDFYRALPYKDISGKNDAQWRIRARSYDYLIRNLLGSANGGEGRKILDLGAGNCWMSYRLALAGHRPVAVDLLTNDRDGLSAARHYQGQLSELFARVQAEMEHLPFASEQFDAAVFNASFHYSENYESTLREALRCVRAGGLVIVSDTAWYSHEESGRQMVNERRAAFLQSYGTASDSIASLEYLTDERLQGLEERLSIRWTVHSPFYGLRWSIRPLAAKVRRRREPSRFRIYVARKRS